MNHPESQIQQACVKLFRAKYKDYILFSVPNGGRRSRIEAAIMRGEGVLPGVADLFLAHASGDFHGLFIEIKSEKGKQTAYQKAFEEDILTSGFAYRICRSVDEFDRIISEYLRL